MKKVILFLFIFIVVTVAVPRFCLASNVTVSNISLTEPNVAANQTIKIEFDISWSNSWRNAVNRDAVWIFARYYDSGDAEWYPVKPYGMQGLGTIVNLTSSGWSLGTGTPLEFFDPYDQTNLNLHYGFILQRSAEGSGDVDTDNIQMVWDWSSTGLSASDSVYVKVFAIEMVYIPQGSVFEIGDGNGSAESTYAFHSSDNVFSTVTTALDWTTKVDVNAYDDSQLEVAGVGISAYGLDTNGDLVVENNYFPTGYYGTYVMKYEISQGQYTAFLSTLNSSMQANRYPGYSGTNRHTITCSAGTCTASRPERACNYLSWQDLCAYCDWAGLRPMTETEFELAARGNNYVVENPIYGEYAWGTTSYTYAQTISGTENGTETISGPDGANVNYYGTTLSGGDTGTGPLRSGIFATSTSNRRTSGASYWGVMELSGNVEEQCVSIGDSYGRSFYDEHGDGLLVTSGTGIGNSDSSHWPGYISGSGVISATGCGRRGGSWASTGTEIATSDRSNASNPVAARDSGIGGRCVHSYGSYYPPP